MKSLLTPAIIAAIATVLIACQAKQTYLDHVIQDHVSGPYADLPADPGDVPPEAELFAKRQ